MLLAATRRLLNQPILTNSLIMRRNMSSVVPSALMSQLKATNGQTITCKAAVAWEPKKPLTSQIFRLMR